MNTATNSSSNAVPNSGDAVEAEEAAETQQFTIFKDIGMLDQILSGETPDLGNE